VQAVWKVGYADGPVDENEDLFYGGIAQFTMGSASTVANPQFMSTTTPDLHLRAASPAIDHGVAVGLTSDLDGTAVPLDGDGDGIATPDIGAYERAASTGGDTVPPTLGAVSVTGSTATSISLAWAPATDNVGVAGYGVYRSGTLVATTSATSFTLSALTCGTTYTAAVDAFDAAGNRSTPSPVTVATKACADTQAPTAPSNLSVTSATASSVSVFWSASIDNVGVAGYAVYLDGQKQATTTTTSYTFSSLKCGTSYTVGVEAFDAAGNTSARSAVVAPTTACSDTIAPTAPAAFTATSVAQTSIATSWQASTDNVGVTGYAVYINGAKAANVTGTTYAFAGLTCGTGYTLGVEAYDGAGNTSARTALTATTSACADTTPPSAPVGFTATSATASSIATTWQASSDNVGVAGYTLYLNGAKKGTATGTSYMFSALSCGSSYSLAVEAFDAAGNVSAKTPLTSSTSACAQPTPSDPVVMAAGDYTACQGSGCSSGNSKAVHDVIAAQNPSVILGLGDFQYDNIDYIINGFDILYGPKPGAMWSLFRPTAGPTHDVSSCTDTRYGNYWNRPAMLAYSFNVGAWHIIQLPSAAYRYGCDTAGVLTWLQNDLASNTAPCTLAFWHEPYWTRPTSEHPTRTTAVKPWVTALYNAGAEIILSGHQHDYQRFAPQTPDDVVDPAKGVRSFIVGTGGIGLYGFTGTAPNVDASDDTTYGALKLTLHATSYDWQFIRAAGGSFTDQGSGACH
jgi:chitodextrinase